MQSNLTTKDELLSYIKSEKQLLEKQVEVDKEGAAIKEQLAQDEIKVQKEQVRVLKGRMEAFQQEMVKKDILITEQMKESLSKSKSTYLSFILI